jgi:signal transduction histidine kinase
MITLMSAFLTDVVLISMVRRDLIKLKIDHGTSVLELIRQTLEKNHENKESNLICSYPALSSEINGIITKTQIAHVLLFGANTKRQFFGKTAKPSIMEQMTRYTEKARQSGKKQIHWKGSISDILWEKKKHLVISTPLMLDGVVTGAVSISVPVEGVYRQMRSSQKTVWFYIILNTLLLTLLGFYRIYRLQIKPIQRLVRIAQDYREEDEIYFSVRKGDDKLQQLSTALNGMLKKISESREALCLTVRSLEKAKHELETAQADIIRAEKLASVGRLSSGIAHEIGNPVGIVLGYLELLKDQDLSQTKRTDYIRRAETEINRISTIIRQLLDISRTSKPKISTVSVHDIIDDTYAVLKVQPLMHNIQIEKSLEAKKNRIKTDAHRLRQVFLNLAINAADAISLKGNNFSGKLKISSRNEMVQAHGKIGGAEMLKISFSDNGPGIPVDKMSAIFDPFYTTKDPGKGTGLGLYVSFMIVESLGGMIKAASESGKGTKISIYLPL